MKYKERIFENKKFKRAIEEEFTKIKSDWLESRNTCNFSLTGPAVSAHVKNISKLNTREFVICDNDKLVYDQILFSLNKENTPYKITTYNDDVFKVIDEYIKNKVLIGDIDLDFPCSVKTVIAPIRKHFPIWFKNINADKFCLTLTFCKRLNAVVRENLMREIFTIIETNSYINKVYEKHYEDKCEDSNYHSSPMYTMLFLLQKGTTPRNSYSKTELLPSVNFNHFYK